MFDQPETTQRILIVEDELIVSADIASRLKRMGYLVTGQADTAERAIELCSESKPDLVLMDIRLKGDVDGVAAADTIRTQYQIPVVFLTAHADEPTLQRAKITEPYGYVLKPFEERELRIVIEMSLYRAKSLRQQVQNRLQLAAILNCIGDAVMAIDPAGKISFLNPVAERLTCYKREEAKGRLLDEIASCHDLLSDAPITLEQLVHSSTKGTHSQELRLRTHSGANYVVIASVTQLQMADGSQRGNVLVVRDISQQRRLEDELRQSQRMEALGQLAVGIAHDLNNILTVICVNHSLLVESIPNNSKESELLTGISQATDRATRMTEQLLAIGKNQVIQPKVLDLNTVVRESMPLLQRLLTENIRWHYQLSNSQLRILADQNQIEQILLNLLINARNAMLQGGTVAIRTSQIDDCTQFGSAPTPAALLEVEDTGCGIDAETQKRIWEPFFSRNEKGTGLGLAVVYGAVKQTGGSVSLVSEIGKGSIFRVYLPLVATT